MPNRMSEDISDRMPEDVPVRLCINVMVGVTRSKVFFAWMVLYCAQILFRLNKKIILSIFLWAKLLPELSVGSFLA